MNSRQHTFFAALGAALLGGCAPPAQEAQGLGGGSDAGPATAAAAPAKKCQVWLEVIGSDDPHLPELPDPLRVRFSGPTQDGDYRIRPMLNPAGHVWLSKDYEAELDNSSGQVFYAAIDVQGPQPAEPTKVHDDVSTHLYEITILEFENGCPGKVRLHTDPHPSSSGIDHGGDADLD